MKKISLCLIIFISLTIILSACVPVTPSAQNQVSEAYIQTAVAKTLSAERALAAGAALTFTETPEDGTPTTPSVDETVDPEPTLEPQPTLENPWMLQSWCEDHPTGCLKYDLNNRTDSWMQVELKKSDTGITGFFTVKSKTIGQITLIPGQYTVKYTWWCDGEAGSFTEVKSLGSWIDVFSCPGGFSQRINK
jgi:hypothetical protein